MAKLEIVNLLKQRLFSVLDDSSFVSLKVPRRKAGKLWSCDGKARLAGAVFARQGKSTTGRRNEQKPFRVQTT